MKNIKQSTPSSGKYREQLMRELIFLEARLTSEKRRRRHLAQELSYLKSKLSAGNGKRFSTRKRRKGGCIDEDKLRDDIQAFFHSYSRLEKSQQELEDRLVELAESANARLQKLTQEMAETEQRERRRIADLLHDDLQQLLAGARFQFQTFAKDHPESPTLENVAQLLDRSIATTRHMTQQLRSTAASPPASAELEKQVIQKRHERQAPSVSAFSGSSGDSNKIRVLLADDHQVMRQGLLSIVADHPRIQVVGEAENGRKAVEMARILRPDIVVMDLNMPEMDGLKATGRIKAELPEVRVIGLSMYEEEEIAMAKAMRLVGAEAYVNKSASPDELLKVIDTVGRKNGL